MEIMKIELLGNISIGFPGGHLVKMFVSKQNCITEVLGIISSK